MIDDATRELMARAVDADTTHDRWTALVRVVDTCAGNVWVQPWLTERGRDDASPRLRAFALEAVTRRWPLNDWTLDALRDAARTDPDPFVQVVATRLVLDGWPADERALDLACERAVSRRPPGRLRRNVLRSAAAHWPHDPRTFVALGECVARDPSWLVRKAAVDTLAGLAARSEDGAAGVESVAALLREVARADPHRSVRLAALVGAVGLRPRDDASTALILDRAVHDADPVIRDRAVGLAARQRPDDPDALPLLLERARTHPERFERSRTARTLAQTWPDEVALPLLHDLATADRHRAVRRSAAKALATHRPDDPGTRAVLEQMADNDGDHRLRDWAALRLGRRIRGGPPLRPAVAEGAGPTGKGSWWRRRRQAGG